MSTITSNLLSYKRLLDWSDKNASTDWLVKAAAQLSYVLSASRIEADTRPNIPLYLPRVRKGNDSFCIFSLYFSSSSCTDSTFSGFICIYLVRHCPVTLKMTLSLLQCSSCYCNNSLGTMSSWVKLKDSLWNKRLSYKLEQSRVDYTP